MGDKFFLRFRQPARSPGPQADTDEGSPSTGGRSTVRTRRHLHDHRINDSLIEYLDDLEK